MGDHEYGWLSVLPPLVAIGLAMTTKRILASLLGGVFIGAMVVADFRLWQAVGLCCERYLWTNLASSDHLRVFAFTLLMGAMVGVMGASRGMDGIVACLAPLARGRRGGQLAVWLMGLVVFFDDYANCLLLGNTMRPLTDRLRLSREKLAYIVDSTAAPVSGLALISTWIAGEISYIRDGFANVEIVGEVNGFAIFVATIPYRFYVLLALVMVPLVAILGRDFGPMLLAERMCRREGRSPGRRSEDETSGPRISTAPSPAAPSPVGPNPVGPSPVGPSPGLAWHAIVPVVATVAVTLAMILYTGVIKQSAESAPSTSWMSAFNHGDSYLALVYGSLCGLLIAMATPLAQRILTIDEARRSAAQGAKHVFGALAILWLSWALSDVTRTDLRAGEYLGALLEHNLQPAWLPTIVFLLASFVAFSTGTSWGTMSVLTPLVVVTTCAVLQQTGETVSPDHPLLLATIGSVLSGAIFGDHCSPISDTTVLSSQASGCEHMAHVNTQMPYALVTAAVAIVVGTIPAGFGISSWWLLLLGGCVLLGILLVVGRTSDD